MKTKSISFSGTIIESIINVCSFALVLLLYFFAKAIADDNSENKLIDQYIESKLTPTIVFSSDNIKQFWVDKTVFSKDNIFYVNLNTNDSPVLKSDPFRIQLKNVNETMDCKVEVLTDIADINFSVYNDKDDLIAFSTRQNDFLKYHIISSTVHLENSINDSFYLVFSSPNRDIISIKRIILSFSSNEDSSYLLSPKIIKVNTSNLVASPTVLKDNSDGSFIVNGTATFNKKIILAEAPVVTTIQVKNLGEKPSRVYVGFIPYSKNETLIRRYNYPSKQEQELVKVVSFKEGSNSIIVEAPPKWKDGALFAIDAREDFSDIPNYNLTPYITDVKERDDGSAEVILKHPLSKPLSKGTMLRVHYFVGGYVYPIMKTLEPGEEVIFKKVLKQTDNVMELSHGEFSKGIYSVVPVIATEQGGVYVKDYTIEF